MKEGIDISKLTDKELVVLRFKATGKPMKQFYDTVGREAGVSLHYGNKLYRNIKRKLGCPTTGQLLSAASPYL